MERYLLFYSNYCQHSKDFIQQLYKSSFSEKFQKVCVDGNKRIPKEIKTVPTIIVPRYPRALEGEEAFNWLRGMNQANLQQQEQQQPSNANPQKGGSSNDGDPTNQSYAMGGVSAFSSTMGGYSDNFSFLGDGAQPIEHNFTFLNSNGDMKIKTPSENDSGSNSEKKSEIDRAYEQMMNQRSREVSGPPPRV